ncbi:MAG: hypothetical protein A2915_02490 [Candidatus Yanofskybacteria bacterium RIFCSPLOWO2_01_FULL_41_34]|uniref:VWFA domain-containing protein n=1 Tax=Candidatus Yanofskybacteria bacterium RIFCSPHIGHO2_01_FULL_41_26 TaxID=1802661 RepID=A0A1F8EEK5_9BACT|nr:MAG: hypothetical protein A2649_04100 [Candidatus Yanofskybacteria bacterium RIFCSPHIGHO2_01_FULL_41_26]OGN20907.1 MAG: hypothetical protein A2915_02490 [Candidatus Yanofskybacteria bacterium RIFCSPLOWO2_01_FULL_41_34]
MPRLDESMQSHKIGGSFTFSAARVERLGAAEYTLVTVAVDETGSVQGFSDQLREMLVTAVESCKKSPRSDNLLIRVITFGTQYKNGVNEIHGFKPLGEIDTVSYPTIKPGGSTPLYDACYSAIGSQNVYGKKLDDQDFSCNGIVFIITDGGENASVATAQMVADEAKKSVSGEILESMISVLIGINGSSYSRWLSQFQKDAGLTQYIDAGDATPRKLAKLAAFVSKSVSSQSQALGTGGPSQNISATI